MSEVVKLLDKHLCISFGPWCQPHKFFKDKLESYETMPNNSFDNTGIPISSINFLIKNKFELPKGYEFDRSNISVVCKKTTKEEMYMHKKLFMRFPHHLPSKSCFMKSKSLTVDDETYEYFVQSQLRKLQRMKQYLSGLGNGYNNIFIIRIEERKETILKNWDENLIEPNILANYKNKTELEQLVEMTDNLKTHFPKVKCKILYISFSQNSKFSKEKQIYVLKADKLPNYRESATYFTQLMENEAKKSKDFQNFLQI